MGVIQAGVSGGLDQSSEEGMQSRGRRVQAEFWKVNHSTLGVMGVAVRELSLGHTGF